MPHDDMPPAQAHTSARALQAALLSSLILCVTTPTLGQIATSTPSAITAPSATNQPDVQSPARLQRFDQPSASAPNQQPAAATPVGQTNSRTFATFPRTYSKAYGNNVIDRSANPGQSKKGQAYNVKARELPRGVTRP